MSTAGFSLRSTASPAQKAAQVALKEQLWRQNQQELLRERQTVQQTVGQLVQQKEQLARGQEFLLQI